jgi:pimeloyl-ACP methyl ester carboxylesterase
VISGEYDSTPPPRTSEQVALDAVNGRFRLIKDCGHYVNLERPALFDEVLDDCLRDVTEVSLGPSDQRN